MFPDYKKIIFVLSLVVFVFYNGQSQTDNDSLSASQKWNIHFQNTEILQFHPGFPAGYSGKNSLNPNSETAVSSTSTLFLGIKLWKYGSFYFNPEVSAGKGFSKTLGVAGFPNGEVYRVSDPKPHFTPARFYIRQIFPLSKNSIPAEDKLNQLRDKIPESYIAVDAGKFSIMDFFDDNPYSHDPRTQFYNWALMGNGAWDYPADTKGYTFGIVVELVRPEWAIRFATVMVPTQANGPVFDADIKHAKSEALEFEKETSWNGLPGVIHLLAYYTQAKMGSYQEAIDLGIANNTIPVIDSIQKTGNTKFGFGFSLAQQVSSNTGIFFRAGWNDGRNETWVFTEIDKTISGGFNFNGKMWHRNNDEIGVAFIANGLSDWHRKYLAAGGYGFIIGDGHLNYSPEMITEVYYSFHINKLALSISPDYQLIINPAYNRDRGPVNAFGLRAHFEF